MSDGLSGFLTNLGMNAGVAILFAGAIVFFLRNTVKTSIEEGVKFGFSRALEEHKEQLSETLEAAKTSLKFSEARFSKQFEALVALRSYFRGIRPRKRFPEMEWDDAMQDLADGLSKHFGELDKLLSQHEAVLPNPVLTTLEDAMTAAEDARFEFDWDSETEIAEPRRRAVELAEEFYRHIEAAVEEMQKTVDAQMPSRKV
ncbi:hypothetical protein [Bradyrhizobium japonicum]|uniref:hypothetical protein n=1 Tax=Bradyrhizobium japonicum TaxID=375 RepID=UPI001BABD3CD|nr:hypothetical protein [Bradyrhizobium japonicum]MBR0910805.1 hypothetical protein [Bradyrhizobium japonicum]